MISLAGDSSVYVDPNVTLTIGLTIGDPQTGATALAKTGGGTLVLSGSNDYTGGTTVDAGTLYVTNFNALPDGSSLTVSGGGTFIFDPSVSGTLAVPTSPTSASGVVAAVPEPGALALLGVGLVVGFGAWRRRKRS